MAVVYTCSKTSPLFYETSTFHNRIDAVFYGCIFKELILHLLFWIIQMFITFQYISLTFITRFFFSDWLYIRSVTKSSKTSTASKLSNNYSNILLFSQWSISFEYSTLFVNQRFLLVEKLLCFNMFWCVTIRGKWIDFYCLKIIFLLDKIDSPIIEDEKRYIRRQNWTIEHRFLSLNDFSMVYSFSFFVLFK